MTRFPARSGRGCAALAVAMTLAIASTPAFAANVRDADGMIAFLDADNDGRLSRIERLGTPWVAPYPPDPTTARDGAIAVCALPVSVGTARCMDLDGSAALPRAPL